MTHQLLKNQLIDLQKLLQRLHAANYNQKSEMLGHVSVGQHVRHILELVQCMVHGYSKGTINYDARKRDLRIETDMDVAETLIEELKNSIGYADKALLLKTENDQMSDVKTFYSRELLYNTEHAIHHMALIRVALREMQLDIVDDDFGVAPATIHYRKNSYA